MTDGLSMPTAIFSPSHVAIFLRCFRKSIGFFSNTGSYKYIHDFVARAPEKSDA